MHHRILAVLKKEIRQISRDKRSLGLLFFLPAFMLVMFGYALNFDVKNIPVAICDNDKSEKSKEFIRYIINNEYFTFMHLLKNEKEADKLLQTEKAKVVIIISKGFSQKILSRTDTSVQVLIDGCNSTTASNAIGYINAMFAGFQNKIISRTIDINSSQTIDYEPRVWYNPELKSVNFLFPGLIAFILAITAVISTSLSIVREKERGSMEQIIVSPVRPWELIVGKTIPYVFIALVSTSLILTSGYLLFDISIKGSYLLLLLVSMLFLTGCLGQGLLISTFSSSQQVAFMIAVISTMLPTFILSGFVFPIRNMPLIIQIITYFIPAKYFIITLRSIILKGVGLEAFSEQILFLCGYASFMIILSTLRLSSQQKKGI
ncbi:MAG: ABC transporter permease [Candidatus Coatesbacteria bacterium]|nr:ABC transporter permease [Candidatus Coatesbacteria bacterium]